MTSMGGRESEQGSATPLSVALGVIGVLAIIGGIVQCITLWPSEPFAGYQWLPTAYVPALTWLVAGLVSGILFFAVAAVLVYLADIRDYLRAIHLRGFARREDPGAEGAPGTSADPE